MTLASEAIRSWSWKEWDLSHPWQLKEAGHKWGEAWAAAAHAHHGEAKPSTSAPKPPLQTKEPIEAIQAMRKGQSVELNQPRQLSSLVTELRRVGNEARAQGAEAPNIDMGKVSVTGKDLFTHSVYGIPRLKMPQLNGWARPGSKADKQLPHDAEGKVNLIPAFLSHLKSKGVAFQAVSENAGWLKPTESQLSGPLVAHEAAQFERNAAAGVPQPRRIVVSKDGYIVDGTHHWAGAVTAGLGNKADLSLPVVRVNQPILPLLAEANRFAKEWGMEPGGIGNPPPRPLPPLGQVWGDHATVAHMAAENPWDAGAPPPDPAAKPVPSWMAKRPRYGTVIFDPQGRVMLREPKGHFSGMVWSFPKGHPDDKEHPVETARRETIEETGHNVGIVGHVPGTFQGSTGEDRYYIAHADDAGQHPDWLNGETERLTWATPEEAAQLLAMSPNIDARIRDLQVLHAAVNEHARLFPTVNQPIGEPPQIEEAKAEAAAKKAKAAQQALFKPLAPKKGGDVIPQSQLQYFIDHGYLDPSAAHPGTSKPLPMGPSTSKKRDDYEGLTSASTMASLDLEPGTLPVTPDGVSDHHITVVYAGKTTPAQWEAFKSAAADVAAKSEPLSGHIAGMGTFPPSESSDWKTPVYAVPTIPGIEKLREGLESFNGSEHKAFKPHVTLTYLERGAPMPDAIDPTPVRFTHLSLHRGDEIIRLPLGAASRALPSVWMDQRNWMKWDAEHAGDLHAHGHIWGQHWAAAAEAARKAHGTSSLPDQLTDNDQKVLSEGHKAAASMPQGAKWAGHGPLQDQALKDHRDFVARTLTEHGGNDLLNTPYSTHISQDRLNGVEGAYTPTREAQHREIINDLLRNAGQVPSEHKAIIMGGLGGAGKSTALRKNAARPDSVAGRLGIKYGSYDAEGHGIGEPTNFLTLNPDNIKEEMAKRGMIPQIGELSPMEGSNFVHEESSKITGDLANEAQRQGKNVIWDITLNSIGSGEKRIDALRNLHHEGKPAGYHVSGVFVDSTVQRSADNALGRHVHGQERYAAGEGFGGRYVPTDLILGGHDPSGQYNSKNRAAFEHLKAHGRFDQTLTIDNTHNEGKIVDSTGNPASPHFEVGGTAMGQSQLSQWMSKPMIPTAGTRAATVSVPNQATGPITAHIQSYLQAETDWPELQDYLASFDYQRPSYLGMHTADRDDLEDVDRYEKNTWGEVRHAFVTGHLSEGEYFAILTALAGEEAPTEGTRAMGWNGWAQWDASHPWQAHQAHVLGAEHEHLMHPDADGDAAGQHPEHGNDYAGWSQKWAEGTKEGQAIWIAKGEAAWRAHWAEHAAHKAVSKGTVAGQHQSDYSAGHYLGTSVGLKLGEPGSPHEVDSKQISDRAAPLYAAAKKAANQGDLAEQARLLGLAHGLKEGARAKAAWEKAHGQTPHQDVKGGQAVKVGTTPKPSVAKPTPKPPEPGTHPYAGKLAYTSAQDLVQGDVIVHGPLATGTPHVISKNIIEGGGTLSSLYGHPQGGGNEVFLGTHGVNKPMPKVGHWDLQPLSIDEHIAKANAAGFDYNAQFDTSKQGAEDLIANGGDSQLLAGKIEAARNLMSEGLAANDSKKVATFHAVMKGYQSALGEVPEPEPIQRTPFTIPDPYKEGTPYHSTFMAGHDEAYAHAKGQQMSAKTATNEANAVAAQAHAHPLVSIAHAALSGTEQGYLHHVHNLTAMPTVAKPTPAPSYPDNVLTNEGPGPKSVGQLAKGDTFAGGYKVEGIGQHPAYVPVTLSHMGQSTTTNHQPDQTINDVIAAHQAKLAAAAGPTVAKPEASKVPTTAAALATLTKRNPGDTWSWGEKVPNTGSNGGQFYEDTAQHMGFLLKPYKSNEHAYNEVAGSLAYQVAGVPAQKVSLVDMGDGKMQALSHYMTDISPLQKSDFTPEVQAQVRKGFGMDALMSHYDLTGMVQGDHIDGPNLFRGKDGTVYRLDLGGTGKFRATGGPKNPKEWGTGDWSGQPNEKNSYETLRQGDQGKVAYGPPKDLSVHGEQLNSLREAGNFDLVAYDKAMADAGIPQHFRDAQNAVLSSRLAHIQDKFGTPAEKPAEPTVAAPDPAPQPDYIPPSERTLGPLMAHYYKHPEMAVPDEHKATFDAYKMQRESSATQAQNVQGTSYGSKQQQIAKTIADRTKYIKKYEGKYGYGLEKNPQWLAKHYAVLHAYQEAAGTHLGAHSVMPAKSKIGFAGSYYENYYFQGTEQADAATAFDQAYNKAIKEQELAQKAGVALKPTALINLAKEHDVKAKAAAAESNLSGAYWNQGYGNGLRDAAALAKAQKAVASGKPVATGSKSYSQKMATNVGYGSIVKHEGFVGQLNAKPYYQAEKAPWVTLLGPTGESHQFQLESGATKLTVLQPHHPEAVAFQQAQADYQASLAAVPPPVFSQQPEPLSTVSASEALKPTTSKVASNDQFHAPTTHYADNYEVAYQLAKATDGLNITQETLQEAAKGFQAAKGGSGEEAQLKGVWDGLKQAHYDWEKAHEAEAQVKKDLEYVKQVGKTYNGKVPFEVASSGGAVPSSIPHGTKPQHATSASSIAYDQAIAQGYDQAVAASKTGTTPEQIWGGHQAFLTKAAAMPATNDDEILSQAHIAGLAQGAGKAAVDLKAGNDQSYPNASSKSVIQHFKPQPTSSYTSHNVYNTSQSDTQLSFPPTMISAIQHWKGEYVYSSPGQVTKGLAAIQKGKEPGSSLAQTFADTWLAKAEPAKQDIQRKIKSHGMGAKIQKFFQPGSTVDIPLTSWSTDPNVWSGDVWLHAPAGTTTLDIGKVGGLAGEAETVTGGRFHIKHMEKHGSITHVYLEQLHPWQPGKGAYEGGPKALGDANVGGKVLTDAELQQWLSTLLSAYGTKNEADALAA